MTDIQPEALRLADALDEMSSIADMGRKPDPKCSRRQAATLLRTQHAEIGRKDALLRRMVDAWDEPNNGLADCYEVVEAIKQELSQ